MDHAYWRWGSLVRILYFSDNHSDHNRRFLEKLAGFGYEVDFLDATQEGSVENWLPRGVRQNRPKQFVHRDADPGDFVEFLAEFQSWVKELRPDVVHAGPVQTCGYVAALSGFHPLVLMSWGSDILLHADRNAEWRRATEVALAAADGFFCDCEAVREAAQRYGTIPNTRIVQFPWGIRRGSFSPQGPAESRESFGWRLDSFVFISTRSWEPLYNIHVLLQAFHLAYRQNNRLRLLLLGDGSEAGRVRSIIAQNDLNEVVVTPGLIAGTETPRWFRAANAYVSCAKSDGTSISLLEAMATGLPAIVTDIPSNREWITEDKNGWLATTGSSKEFAAKLLRAASRSLDHLEAISERNQSVVTERADWDRNFPKLLRLYEFLARSALVMRA
jgi:glycosyltransferase involved in cell wall biosynthesis